MIFQQLNRTDSERVFVTVQNVEGATITTGLPVSNLPTGVSIDGVQSVIANSAGDLPGFIGIAVKDIPNNDYGLVQIAGFVNSILISNVGTSLTIGAGSSLIPAPVGMFSSAAFSGNGVYALNGGRFVFASSLPSQPAAISAAGYLSGIIKMI